jgi:hypothetical protein
MPDMIGDDTGGSRRSASPEVGDQTGGARRKAPQ